MRALLVDDREENLYYLQALLRGHGHDVVVAHHGAEALTIARQARPDVVISDLLMPVMDGYMLLRQWKADPSLNAAPFLVYTATYTSERDEELALSLGADAFILKPCEPDVFLRRLAEVMEATRGGKGPATARTDLDDRSLYSEYSTVLIRKLEEKMLELENSNKALEQDITDRRAVEAALRESETRLRVLEREASENAAVLQAVLQSIPDHVTYVDLDGVPRASNLRGLVLGGGARPWGWLESLSEERRQRTQAAWRETLATLRATTFELTDIDVDATERVTWNTLAPVTRDRVLTGILVVSQDITARKAAEGQLLVSERMVALGAMAASVAHEVNNPLASISANLALAQEELETLSARSPVSQDLREELRDASEAAERVRLIVRDLRMFSRESADREGPVSVEPVLESTLRIARNELRHRARVVTDLRPMPPVHGNEARLGQVFLNLLMNAAQAIPVGRVHENEIRIAVTHEKEKNRVVVAISDTGLGMSPAVQKQLFRPFVTTKPAGEGTGLGLSICKKIVTDLGGDIDFQSEPGHGTTFFVRLPATGPLVQPIATSAASTSSPERGTVLIIDDDEAVGRLLRRILAKEHEVVVTRSAAEALTLIRDGRRFDVILCDLMMPEISGIDFYEALEGLDEGQTQRLVFMTGGAFSPSAVSFLSRVDAPRLEKPFTPEAVSKLIAERISALTHPSSATAPAEPLSRSSL